MKKYVCSICGFIYDEVVGYPDAGIAPGTKWEDIPEDWVCPLCGASKDDFQEEAVDNLDAATEVSFESNSIEQIRELSFGEVSALCSNLSKGCTKQQRTEEADLFNQLSEYFRNKDNPVEKNQFEDLLALIEQDLNSGYSTVNNIAGSNADRGALRAAVWGEKVTKVLNSLVKRYETQKDSLLENTNVYVCEICGFVFIGDEAPDVCPVCKVPKTKLTQIPRR